MIQDTNEYTIAVAGETICRAIPCGMSFLSGWSSVAEWSGNVVMVQGAWNEAVDDREFEII